jgi:hypothetical protein
LNFFFSVLRAQIGGQFAALLQRKPEEVHSVSLCFQPKEGTAENAIRVLKDTILHHVKLPFATAPAESITNCIYFCRDLFRELLNPFTNLSITSSPLALEILLTPGPSCNVDGTMTGYGEISPGKHIKFVYDKELGTKKG